ncbi:hypothetical protein E0J16_34075 [Rhizobium pisi]|uniref:hypothetical protein n=1 Tax=Rhizobium pisi TaxID=574561 RepID=UPI00103A8DB0|nr:hypothetical protein [Rhizobium pisi]TCA41718.1 hypothetical protein E0J16_34075 [Rhizobium pisi]
MHRLDLSKLNAEQLADYHRRYQANLALYGLDASAAVSRGGGLIDRIASACALRDTKNRRQTVWSKR